MATETQKPEVEVPKKSLTPLDLNQDTSKSEENPNPNPNLDTNGAAAAAASSKGLVSPTGDDIHKKMKRAERFGVPVNMSEEEKRCSRSQRFGTSAGSEVSKSAEDQKRKARAERFGISVPADEEIKKKSRAERFGSDVKVDNAEEERRKARALRFSHSQAAAVARSNGDNDSGPQETATMDSASEGG